MPDLTNQIFKYKGKFYRVKTEFRYKKDGVWVESILYEPLYAPTSSKYYGRERDEFMSIFEAVPEGFGFNSQTEESMCPLCGSKELAYSVITTVPPKAKATCTKCGAEITMKY